IILSKIVMDRFWIDSGLDSKKTEHIASTFSRPDVLVTRETTISSEVFNRIKNLLRRTLSPEDFPFVWKRLESPIPQCCHLYRSRESPQAYLRRFLQSVYC